ncbi:hypothetical protein BAE44_0014084 [Dichanthelium oligosanthes]|uniref:Rhamnogalacturonan endolyase n=1 Tax=Dichanthelium oligosanthes TaxID=888268 RepID=A0A1E5VIJ0_9POAL|nr:hypothetical protein BAE44_0014084 [Dichanthelium oligosanthes]
MAAAPRCCLKLAVGALLLVLLFVAAAAAAAAAAASPPEAAGGVTLHVDDPLQVAVDNGVVQVSLSRPQGHITGVRYSAGDDQNLLEYNASQGNSGGYWDVVWNYPGSNHPKGMMDMLDGTEFQVVSSSEEQVELSFRSSYNASRPTSLRLNVDKRLVMLRGSSGFYCYAIFEHAREWPALNISVARLAFKLNAAKFKYMAISDDIQRYMPSAEDRDPPRGVPLAYKEAVLLVDPVEPEFRGEVDDKYQYSLENQDNTVHGWIGGNDDPAAAAAATGFWVITPSNEFKNGGPLKRELTSHTGPTSLAVFLGPHYVGTDMVIKFEEGEYWKKVLGPVFIYVNSGHPDSKRDLWEDAKAQAQAEVSGWPYSFPRSPDFSKAGERGSITGRLWVRDDGVAKQQPAAMAYVGLAAPGQPGSWATESKRYQFWTRATSDGSFSIGNVREGVYNLYAWVPGILGDYMRASPVTLTPAVCAVDVGDLVFEPPRLGPTLWEIGVPDRTAAEFYVPDPDPRYASRLFLTKDRYRQYGLWERYAALYPDSDLVFTVGESNHSRDWFFAHVTRRVGDEGMIVPTTWQIHFHLDRVVAGGDTYTLRIALAASHMSSLQVQVNGGGVWCAPPALQLMGDNNAIARHGIRGTEWSLDFDVEGHLLNQGDNTISITQASALSQFAGVMYDYIRLEGPASYSGPACYTNLSSLGDHLLCTLS